VIEAGCGKSVLGNAVALELRALGFPVAIAHPATAAKPLLRLPSNLRLTLAQLKVNFNHPGFDGGYLRVSGENTAFLICDEAQRMQVQLRCWLESCMTKNSLYSYLQPSHLHGTSFLKLPQN